MSIADTAGKGAVWSTAASTLGKLVVFLNVFIILRHLSVYEYGLSELVFSVVTTFSIFLLSGLYSAIIADLVAERAQGEYGKMKTIFWQYFLLNLVLGSAAFLILFFGSSYVAHFAGNESIGYFLKIVSFGFLSSPLRSVSTMLATVELRFADLSFYSVFEEIAKFAFLVLFFFVFHDGIAGLLYAWTLCGFAIPLFYLPRTISAYRVFGKAVSKNTGAFWDILRRHRKWSIVGTYIGNLGSPIQIWIIRLMLGTDAVGLYAFATGVIGQLTAFMPFDTILGPIVPRYLEKRDELVRLIRSSLKAQLLFGVLLALGALVLIPLIPFVFPKYKPALLLLAVLLLTLLPNAIASVFTPVFYGMKQQKTFVLSMIIKVGLNTIALPLSILAFGPIGMAIGSIIGGIGTMTERRIRLRTFLPEFHISFLDFFRFDSMEEVLFRDWVNRLKTKGPLFLFRL